MSARADRAGIKARIKATRDFEEVARVLGDEVVRLLAELDAAEKHEREAHPGCSANLREQGTPIADRS